MGITPFELMLSVLPLHIVAEDENGVNKLLVLPVGCVLEPRDVEDHLTMKLNTRSSFNFKLVTGFSCTI